MYLHWNPGQSEFRPVRIETSWVRSTLVPGADWCHDFILLRRTLECRVIAYGSHVSYCWGKFTMSTKHIELMRTLLRQVSPQFSERFSPQIIIPLPFFILSRVAGNLRPSLEIVSRNTMRPAVSFQSACR